MDELAKRIKKLEVRNSDKDGDFHLRLRNMDAALEAKLKDAAREELERDLASIEERFFKLGVHGYNRNFGHKWGYERGDKLLNLDENKVSNKHQQVSTIRYSMRFSFCISCLLTTV